jgi:hypothetical protein
LRIAGQQLDILPTLLDMAGRVPAGVDGRSLKNVALGRSTPAREEVIAICRAGADAASGRLKFNLNIHASADLKGHILENIQSGQVPGITQPVDEPAQAGSAAACASACWPAR